MKKIISLILAIIILGTSVFAEDTQPAPSDWAVESIEKAQALGILEEGKVYNYTEAITREEFCELAYNVLVKTDYFDKWYNDQTKNGTQPIPPFYTQPFEDTSNDAVITLLNHGIIKGKSETLFAPNDLLTREEAAVILHRMYKSLGLKEISYRTLSLEIAGVSDWAYDDVYCMHFIGIMLGMDDNGLLAPKESFTEEQAITTLVRLYDTYKSQTVEYNTFADKLSSQMPDDENYMISPLSIKMALALAANGADGETKDEILNAIEVEDLDKFNEYSKEMIKKYSEQDLIRLDIANSIWTNNDRTNVRFATPYFNTVSNFYNAESKKVTNETALDEVNGWVNEKTNGKIPTIINDSNFETMLLNAVYFKAAWADEFDEHATKPDEFNNIDGTVTDTDFMNKTDYFNYCNTGNARILEIPYNNISKTVDEEGFVKVAKKHSDLQVSMYILMSDYTIAPVEELTNAINNNMFTNELVYLSMPKFEIEFEQPLNGVLQNLGIKKAFTDKADFSKMFENSLGMRITDTLHKTYINVNEKETEAAAVTMIALGSGAPQPIEPLIFKADRPFTFIIRDNSNGEILFIGEYVTAK